MTTIPPTFRAGIGFDAHALSAGRRLVLGGVAVPFERGLAGHSDGDVLAHAVMDALLGAANLGDKGQHFPSADEQYRDISSLRLLRQIGDLLAANRWQVNNIDATMLAQQPRLGPFIRQWGKIWRPPCRLTRNRSASRLRPPTTWALPGGRKASPPWRWRPLSRLNRRLDSPPAGCHSKQAVAKR